ncbi:MAG: porin family protein [Acidobacteriia bacterium]|nr:porin family protein [Terriglobia bacterium]
MRKLVVLIVLLGLFAIPLMAQDTPKAEVFGGYQYLHTGTIHVSGVGDIPDSSQSFNGWDANATYYFNKNIGVQGDFSGSYATFDFFDLGNASSHVYTYTGGPVVALNAGGKVNPFVHALFGGIRLSSSQSGLSVSLNGFTTMVGGGVDVKVAPRIAFRLIQADWVYFHFGSTTIAGTSFPSLSGSKNVRIATGIVFRF